MLRIRPMKDSDMEVILAWTQDEAAFYRWTAGVLGTYPITTREFAAVRNLMAFTAIDEKEITGFFTFRNPKETLDELRFGFVVVDPRKRGMGYGKQMLRLGMQYAKWIYGAKKVSLGVFENNPAAYHCYKAAGFRDLPREACGTYHVMGEDWTCLELECSLDSI